MPIAKSFNMKYIMTEFCSWKQRMKFKAENKIQVSICDVCVLPVDSAAFAVWLTDFDYIPPPWLWFRLFILGDRRINVQENYRAKETTQREVGAHTLTHSHSLWQGTHEKGRQPWGNRCPLPPPSLLSPRSNTQRRKIPVVMRGVLYFMRLYTD